MGLLARLFACFIFIYEQVLTYIKPRKLSDEHWELLVYINEYKVWSKNESYFGNGRLF